MFINWWKNSAVYPRDGLLLGHEKKQGTGTWLQYRGTPENIMQVKDPILSGSVYMS